MTHARRRAENGRRTGICPSSTRAPARRAATRRCHRPRIGTWAPPMAPRPPPPPPLPAPPARGASWIPRPCLSVPCALGSRPLPPSSPLRVSVGVCRDERRGRHSRTGSGASNLLHREPGRWCGTAGCVQLPTPTKVTAAQALNSECHTHGTALLFVSPAGTRPGEPILQHSSQRSVVLYCVTAWRPVLCCAATANTDLTPTATDEDTGRMQNAWFTRVQTGSLSPARHARRRICLCGTAK